MADNNLLASNLAQLGGQIASTFQNVALQNQYKNSLPAMQQVFQQSMADFDSGKTGAGFARIMDVAMQNPNNPYIQNMAQMAFRVGQIASDDYFKRQQIDIARSKANAKGSTLIPEGFFDEGDGLPTSSVPNTAEVIAKNNDATPEEQQKLIAGATVSKDNVQLQPGQKIRDASFLQKYGLPVESIVGPSVYDKSQVDSVTKSLSSRGATISQVKKNVTQNKEIAQAFDQDFASLTQADRLLQSDSQMQDLLSQSGNNIFNIQASQVPSMTGGKDKSYVAKIGNNKPVDITEDQYKAIVAIKGAGAGVRAYGGSLVSKQEDWPVKEQPAQQPSGQPTSQTTEPPAPKVSGGAKQSEFSNQENPFFQAVQKSQISTAPKGGGRAGKTGEGRAKQIQAQINSIDERIKTIENRRGSAQDKYRAYESLTKERDQLIAELSKFSK